MDHPLSHFFEVGRVRVPSRRVRVRVPSARGIILE
jgi:hypothetical protein